ncbi:DUF2889 domain-containing protein [Ramlibacter sp.]|uniref:DUF2889 domain-containing protein n=1 Tax=Ramlibacter sp. TaxID=1917967 RepID=UPI003D0EA554
MAERKRLHTRTVVCDTFQRDDGLFDVEARIEDRKHYEFSMLERGPYAPGEPYHSIGVNLVVDGRMKIVAVGTDMAAHPFDECKQAAPPAQKLVGATLGRGWRKAVDEAVGGAAGCTHMREMLYAMASSAIQAIPTYARLGARATPPDPAGMPAKPPPFIDGCHSWRSDGRPVVTWFPMYAKKS